MVRNLLVFTGINLQPELTRVPRLRSAAGVSFVFLFTWEIICHTTTTILTAVSGKTLTNTFSRLMHLLSIEPRVISVSSWTSPLWIALIKYADSAAAPAITLMTMVTESPTDEGLPASKHCRHSKAVQGAKPSAQAAQSVTMDGRWSRATLAWV